MADGTFVWYELMTTDLAAAQAFYSKVIGWDVADAGMPGQTYLIAQAAGVPVGGIMGMPEALLAAGHGPAWRGHVGADVDAIAASIAAAGGAVLRAPEDIPGVGRFAVVHDPQGAVFLLFRGNGPAPAPVAAYTPGHVGWNELHSSDPEAAFGFNAAQFGWTKGVAHDMGGPVGVYQIFQIGGADAGGMMKKDPAQPNSVWVYYFNVADIDAAIARVGEAGGTLVHGPHEVPGGAWIAVCVDPQGAGFAMVGMRGA